MYKIINGDASIELGNFPDNYFDAVITDPPAGIAFMGNEWDSLKGSPAKWIEWLTGIMRECYRIIKPGAHGLIWALPKISHRTATACELAGFEIRDIVYHLFSSGFPKSMSIGKQIDKKAGMVREVIGINQEFKNKHGAEIKRCQSNINKNYQKMGLTNKQAGYQHPEDVGNITAPATDLAKQWEGWGTALKPCIEHWLLIRKPISEKNITDNILKWGTGGINIDGCRIPTDDELSFGSREIGTNGIYNPIKNKTPGIQNAKGRWPAQLIHDGSSEVMAEFEKYGEKTSGAFKNQKRSENKNTYASAGNTIGQKMPDHESSSGSIARFFYCAKPCSAERNEGLENLPCLPGGGMSGRKDGSLEGKVLTHNAHPTVKSIALMKFLVTLVTPPGGKIIDPFAGSGTTGIAAELLGFDSVLIEQYEEYIEIIKHRLKHIDDYREPEIFDAEEIQNLIYREAELL